ncbi:3',5'-cyclic-nucleotide phosphodiesterase [Coemansia spiralis]|uniref:Phosphodiesterase n=2 Tax=Coemansia TaxID=4863 RepID=A0A9W8G7D0_9FUNG|nr:3',5'-cyclic-nucleotide phosphodiesterase [Coemansia spiralis]
MSHMALNRTRGATDLLEYYKRRNSIHNVTYRMFASSNSSGSCIESTSSSIAMSSSHDPSFMRQVAGIGAMNYLVKPISAETVHSLWLNVFSCRTHGQASTAQTSVNNGLTIDDKTSQAANSAAMIMHESGDASTLSPQQTIFQRRIRTDTINGASTADTRNASFEEDFIRQFVPAISTTLPTNSESSGADEYLEDCDDDLEREFLAGPRAESLRTRLLDWSFCPYEMEREDLIDCVVIMIMDSAACVDLKLRIGRVRKFASILESAYYDNPYHNFHHAVDVTQCTFYILHTLGLFSKTGYRRSSLRSPSEASFPLRSILRPTDAIALVVASLCHDLGHPGLNNAFMIRAHTQLAEIYNDQSVLENFHAACFSMIMSYVFADFSSSRDIPGTAPHSHSSFDYEEFRRIAVHAILATDMARHFEFIGKCKAQYERFMSRSNLPLTPQQHEAERAQLAASILKCADISNIVRPFNISQCWTRRLNKEVTLQGNIEESLGLSRSAIVDLENVPASQIAFYESCGRPLFNAVADLVPELRFMPDQLENNIRNWGFIKNNQRVPEVPYGLKHASTFELSISTRAGSTDSAPDFLQKRSFAGGSITPTANIPFDASTTTVENEHLAAYTLHAGDSIDRLAVSDDLSATTQQMPSPHDSSDSGKLAAHLFVPAGVLSPPYSQH